MQDLSSDEIGEVVKLWSDTHNRCIAGTNLEKSGFVDPSGSQHIMNSFAARTDNKVYFGEVLCLDGVATGLMFAARTGPSCAAIYTSICVQGSRGASETQMIHFLSTLHAAGIETANLGGSETDGLFRYKKKFLPKRLIELTDFELCVGV